MQIITIIFMYIVATHYSSANGTSKHDWDVLIFTQHWPNTVCMEWKEIVPEHNCIMPTQNGLWTVHGIWPTKLGTIGPGYCNSSWHFDRSQLSPIEPQLEQEWGNVHTGDRYVLWQHEWEKHGTCAAQLPSLGSELLYFGQGLAWVQQYNVSRVLLEAGISPDSQARYDAGHLSDAVRNALGKDPAIECLVHKKTGVVYLFEIRICFDKSLQLTDCDGIKTTVGGSKVITNCPAGKAIMYPLAPPQQEPAFPRGDYPQRPHLPWLLQLLNSIHWLQWLTM